jgi:hypothetical protein
VLQSLWGLEGIPWADLDDGLADTLRRVAAAGFDGVGANLALPRQAQTVAQVSAELGQTWEAQCRVFTADELARFLEQTVALGGANHVNVQIGVREADLDRAIALMRSLLAVSRQSPLPVFYETHRGRLTNDLGVTAALLEALPELRLTGDLSHYVVAHSMPLPVGDQNQAAISQVLDRCNAFHGRVAGGHQVQLALHGAWQQPWVEQFARTEPDARLTFLCELGPPDYAITDTQGRELSDRWGEALELKAMARDLFARARASRPADAGPQSHPADFFRAGVSRPG